MVPLWSKAKANIQRSAYHFKAPELASSTFLSGFQCAYRGCAGIGCQLHHLKAEHFMWMPWSKNQKTMYMVKYIIQKLFSSRVQLSYHDFSVLFEGVLVVNCIKSELWKKSINFKKSWAILLLLNFMKSCGMEYVTKSYSMNTRRPFDLFLT